MPLVSENLPKCYMCHRMFQDIERLREHHRECHSNLTVKQKSEPAPGDVTVF